MFLTWIQFFAVVVVVFALGRYSVNVDSLRQSDQERR